MNVLRVILKEEKEAKGYVPYLELAQDGASLAKQIGTSSGQPFRSHGLGAPLSFKSAGGASAARLASVPFKQPLERRLMVLPERDAFGIH